MSSGGRGNIQLGHEVLTSLNVASTLVAFYLVDLDYTSTLFRMDHAVSRYMGLLPPGLLKDEYTNGYFAFFVPAASLTCLIWLLLRSITRGWLGRAFLQSGAGIAAISAAPAWWIFRTYGETKGWGSRFWWIQSWELAVVVILGFVYIWGYRKINVLVVSAIIVIHYGFWLSQFGSAVYFCGYGGPFAPTLGLISCVTWLWFRRLGT